MTTAKHEPPLPEPLELDDLDERIKAIADRYFDNAFGFSEHGHLATSRVAASNGFDFCLRQIIDEAERTIRWLHTDGGARMKVNRDRNEGRRTCAAFGRFSTCPRSNDCGCLRRSKAT